MSHNQVKMLIPEIRKLRLHAYTNEMLSSKLHGINAEIVHVLLRTFKDHPILHITIVICHGNADPCPLCVACYVKHCNEIPLYSPGSIFMAHREPKN